MYTRQQYMKNEVDHSTYFGQFVNDDILNLFSESILLKIENSEDSHFNDIPLATWDSLGMYMPKSVRRMMLDTGEGLSIASHVCILKAAARSLRGW